ncbi:MAG: hypothetical protein WDO14_07115 [Bacteroidota bacterium]
MAQYTYKVDYFHCNVTASDISNNTAGTKVAQQVEEKINAYMNQGFELYQQFNTVVEVKPGCLASLMGKTVDYVTITTTVFRKEGK